MANQRVIVMAQHKALYKGHAVAAVSNAVSRAAGLRITDLPISPSHLLEKIQEAGRNGG